MVETFSDESLVIKTLELEKLGDYKIIKEIGEGTLGKTLLAEHKFTHRLFVLKVLPEELALDSSFLLRFEKEVAHLATLDHPHIVKIHTVSCADENYFLVMDSASLPNQKVINLAQLMKEKKERLPEELLLHIAISIAGALEYAHTKKPEPIAHLSIKPSNILLSTNVNGTDVYLSDFGLAKIIGIGAVVARSYKAVLESLEFGFDEGKSGYLPYSTNSAVLIDLSRSFLESFAFLAPEQKRLDIVGPPADIYAFGTLLYYLISGLFPEGCFEMPSQIAPEYGFPWDRLIVACLNPKPERRPQAIMTFIDELKKQKASLAFRTGELKAEKSTLDGVKAALKQDQMDDGTVSFRNSRDAKVLSTRTVDSARNVEPNVKTYYPEKNESQLLEPLLTDVRVISAGYYLRGSNEGSRDEMPYHKIFLNEFAIDIHPVTNEQFVRFLEYMGTEKDLNHNDLIRLKDSRISRHSGKYAIESGYWKHPIVGVTWYGAAAYAKWVGRRLPTEAEWEVAAQGGLANPIFPTGETIEKNQANFFSSDTTPVMSYPPNSFDLYDMAGNVYEWCQDWYGYNYYEASCQEPNNPKGPPQGVYRVLRGGCWKSLKDDLRTSHRHRNNPGTVNGTYGFRCVAEKT